MWTRPEVGSTMRLIIRIRVVLPEPEEPTSTTDSWEAISRLKSSTASVPPGYSLRTFSNPITGPPDGASWGTGPADRDHGPGADLSEPRNAGRRPSLAPRLGAVDGWLGRRRQRRTLLDAQRAAVHGERRTLGEGGEAGLRVAGRGDQHPVGLGPPPEVVHLDRLVGGSLGRIVLGEGDKRARGAEQAVQRLGRASEELGGERGELGGGVLDGERPVDPALPRRELRRP